MMDRALKTVVFSKSELCGYLLLAALICTLAKVGECHEGLTTANELLDYVRYNRAIDKGVHDALLFMNLSNAELTNGETITDAMYRIWLKDSQHMDIYEVFQAGWPVQSEHCSNTIVDHCLSIFTQKDLTPFRPLVRHHEDTLLKCSQRELDNLKRSKETFALFDKFFKAAVVVNRSAKESELLELLTNFDVKLDGLHLEEAAKALKKARFPGPKSLPDTALSVHFLNSQCPIFERYRSAFNLINLVKQFSGWLNLDQRTLILNEYNRICSAWLDDSQKNKELEVMFHLLSD